MPEKDLQDYELLKRKYFKIAEVMKCAIWEYNIKTHTMHMVRKLDGKYSDHDHDIENYRDRMKKWGIIHPDDMDIFESYCDSMDNGEDDFTYDIRQITDGDEYVWLRYFGKSLRDDDGNLIYSIGVTLDVTDERSEKKQLIEKASTDSLTGLLNKESTRLSIIECLKKSKSNNRHALFIIDVDDFKYINDTFGHLFGDKVLKNFSHEMKKLFPNDIVGRIGGDEFFLFVKNYRGIAHVTESAMLVSDIAHSIKLGDDLTVTTSIGVSLYPRDGNNFEILYSNSDAALYHTKLNGKNNFSIYAPGYRTEYAPYKNERKKGDKSKSNDNDKDANTEIISFAINTLYNINDTDEAVKLIFSEIGYLFNLERIYMYKYDQVEKKGEIKYLFDDTGMTESTVEHLRKRLDSRVSEFENMAFEKQTYVCTDANDSKNYHKDDSEENIPLFSFFYVFSYSENEFDGMIAFEDCSGTREWSSIISNTLTIISRIIYMKLVSSGNISQVVLPEKNESYNDAENTNTNISIASGVFSSEAVSDDIDGLLTLEEFKEQIYTEITTNREQSHNIVYVKLVGLEKIKFKNGIQTAKRAVKLFFEHMCTTLADTVKITRISEIDFVFLTYANEPLPYDRVLCMSYGSASKLTTDLLSVSFFMKAGIYYIDAESTDFDNFDIEEALLHSYEALAFIDKVYPHGCDYAIATVFYEEKGGVFDNTQWFNHCIRSLRQAIDNDEMRLAVTPELSSQGDIVSGEATLQWFSEDGKVYIYEEYLTAATANGLIVEIEKLFYTRFFRTLKKIDISKMRLKMFTVKISDRTIKEPGIAEYILELLERYSVDPSVIEFQITEDALWFDFRSVSMVIVKLKQAGFKICICNITDTLPVYELISLIQPDAIRLHPEVLARGVYEENQKALIKTVSDFAKKSNFALECAKINNNETVDYMKDSGATLLSGGVFYYGIPFEDFEELVEKKNKEKDEEENPS